MHPVAQAAPLAASTYRVNAHGLPHAEIHGKTNNATHPLWLYCLFEFGGDASLPGGLTRGVRCLSVARRKSAAP